MALRVITGTITEASDPFDHMAEMQATNLLDRLYWTVGGWRKKPAKLLGLGTIRDGGFKIIQPTSVGKTVLAATLLFKTHIHGGNIGANLKLAWTENEIKSMEDLSRQINTHILIDDLRSTIIGWKSKAALMVSEVANAGGKKNN